MDLVGDWKRKFCGSGNGDVSSSISRVPFTRLPISDSRVPMMSSISLEFLNVSVAGNWVKWLNDGSSASSFLGSESGESKRPRGGGLRLRGVLGEVVLAGWFGEVVAG